MERTPSAVAHFALPRLDGRCVLVLAAAALVLSAWTAPSPSRPAEEHLAFTGNAASDWIPLAAGTYGVSVRAEPAGCLLHAALTGVNGYEIMRWPGFVGHLQNPIMTESWSGFDGRMVTGRYRVIGEGQPGCRWWALVSPNPDTGPRSVQTVAVHCADLSSWDPSRTVQISGRRVAMPAADPIFEVVHHEIPNTFAYTGEVVPHSTRGIAIDDGSGICPVLWNAIGSPPSMGGRAAVTGEELVGHHSGVFIAQSR